MRPFLPAFLQAKNLLSFIIKGLEIFSSVILAFMALLTFIDVICRYFFTAPIFGASEMIQALLALVIFSGLGIANAHDDHIVVELFDEKIKKLSPRLYQFIIQLASITGMGLIAWVLFNQTLRAIKVNSRTVVLELPLYWIVGTITILATISLLAQVIGVFLNSNEPKRELS